MQGFKTVDEDSEVREAEQQHFHFLDLPPELRNMMYKFALVEGKGNVIDITPQLKPPGLLAACRQIRQECLQIWYHQNTFSIKIYDCDASLKMALRSSLQDLE
jgi:hypothetical protein